MTNSKRIERLYAPNDELILKHLLLGKNPAAPPAYVVLDPTGGNFTMMVRSQVDGKDVLAEASTANSKIVIEPLTQVVNGTSYSGDGLVITFSAADTLAIYQGTTLEYAQADLRVELPILEQPKNGALCLNLFADIYATRDYSIIGECP